MKPRIILLPVVLFTLFICTCTRSDQAYLDAMDDFYHWDTTRIESIRSHVRSSILDDVLASIESQLAPHSEYLALDHTLDSFSIAYILFYFINMYHLYEFSGC